MFMLYLFFALELLELHEEEDGASVELEVADELLILGSVCMERTIL